MLLSSASIRAVLMILPLVTCLSCASAPPEYSAPRPAEAAGTLRISGSHPYERQLVLESESGDYWLLNAPALEGEMLLLDGQRVRVHGKQCGAQTGSRELAVEWYELIAQPGAIAGVGTLGSYQGVLVLRCDQPGTEAEARILLQGPLRKSLGHFVGYRIWIRGERMEAGMGEETAGASGAASDDTATAPDQPTGTWDTGLDGLPVIVREYGVLGPPTSPLRDAPHSTYPDSSR